MTLNINDFYELVKSNGSLVVKVTEGLGFDRTVTF